MAKTTILSREEPYVENGFIYQRQYVHIQSSSQQSWRHRLVLLGPADEAIPPPPTATRISSPTGNGASFAEASYGGALPIVFGSDKITGNIIWASKVTTHSVLVGTDNIQFSSVDFAIALAEGPIEGVLRIWTGDRLIYDARMATTGNTPDTRNGVVDSTVIDITEPGSPLRSLPNMDRECRLTFYSGNETQIPDGVMASLDGYSNTPAYRGCSFIVFENYITSGTDIPSLTFETASNTTDFYPRLEATIPSSGPLTDIEDNSLLVNNVFGQVHAYADGGGAGNGGLVTWTKNTLNTVSNVEYNNAFLSQQINNAASSFRSGVMTGSGIAVYMGGTGNPGVVFSVNAGAGVGIDTLGPGPSFTIDETGFPALTQDMEPFRYRQFVNGPWQEAVAICDNWSESIGIVTVSDFGILEMGPYLDQGVVVENVKICYMQMADYNFATYPSFVDGGITLGHFFFFIGADDGEQNEFTVGRVEFKPAEVANGLEPSSAFELESTTHSAKISFGEFNGTGLSHEIVDIIANPKDATLIVLVNSTQGEWVFKYNPYTDTIVWKTQTNIPTAVGPMSPAKLNDQDWAWIANNTLYLLDLKTGRVQSLIEDIVADQSLTSAANVNQYYDGDERSVTYLGASNITKVFLSRSREGITSLPTIIETLFNRVNYNRSRYNLSDVSALNLRGFSIREVASLRDILTTLRQVYLFEMIESNGRIQYVPRGASSAATIANKYLGDLGDQGSYLETKISPDLANLRKINFTYADVDREYQTNVQSIYYPPIESLGFDNDAAIDVKVPIVLTADEARYNADKLLYAKRLAERQYQARVPFRFAYLDPGDIVTIQVDDAGDETVVARITRVTVTKDYKVEWELVADDPDIYGDDPGYGGVIGKFYSLKFAQQAPFFYPYLLPTGWVSTVVAGGLVTLIKQGRRPFFDRNYAALLDFSGTQTEIDPELIRFALDTQLEVQNAKYAAAGLDYASKLLTPTQIPSWGFVVSGPEHPPNLFSPQTDNSVTIRVIYENPNTPFETSDLTWDDGDFWTYNDTTYGLAPTYQGNVLLLGEELIRFHTVTDNGDGTITLSNLIRACVNTDHYYGEAGPGDIAILLYPKDGSVSQQERFLATFVGAAYGAPDGTGAGAADASEAIKPISMGIISSNPYQRDLVGQDLSYTQLLPKVKDVEIELNGSNEYDITWNRRSLFVSAFNLNANDTKFDEWTESGVNTDTDLYWLGAETPVHDIVVSDASTLNGRDPDSYLRKTRVTGSTSWTYTSAMQTEDGFDYTTDTLYVHIIPVSPFIGDVLYAVDTYSLAP